MYKESIKKFNKIRPYLRNFYIYGFRCREDYDEKSSRSYDDEKRRIESLLSNFVMSRNDKLGKHVYISFDSRTNKNPFFEVLKTKSFTDKDITLHFILFDILDDSNKECSLNEIIDSIDSYLSNFDSPITFDESTIRKKINEYIELGLIKADKTKKQTLYSRSSEEIEINKDLIEFFKEVSPLGVVGSYILDKKEDSFSPFRFKHHYITGVLDSEMLEKLIIGINEKRYVTLHTKSVRKNKKYDIKIIPLKIYISVSGGRNYVMSYDERRKRFASFRLDNIYDLEIDEICENYDFEKDKLIRNQKYIYGISVVGGNNRIEHVEFVIKFSDNEYFIHERLVREKRNGIVTKIDKNTSKYECDTYDSKELIPWIRTFIGRIIEINFSSNELEESFLKDLDMMYKMYEIDMGEEK